MRWQVCMYKTTMVCVICSRYLLCEVEKVYKEKPSKLLTLTSNNLCRINENVSFHMYMSLTPCKWSLIYICWSSLSLFWPLAVLLQATPSFCKHVYSVSKWHLGLNSVPQVSTSQKDFRPSKDYLETNFYKVCPSVCLSFSLFATVNLACNFWCVHFLGLGMLTILRPWPSNLRVPCWRHVF